MNVIQQESPPNRARSDVARERPLARTGDAMFAAAWERVLMIHFEVDANALQRDVPFELDLFEGRRAFVSLVAFSMRGLRPIVGGRIASWLFKPIATHDFLNVRTYVRHGRDTGIHFLAEWLSSWLAVQLGPRTFSLPYRFGWIGYDHAWERGALNGRVTDARSRGCFAYRSVAETTARLEFGPCESGTLDAWLMERYAAFNATCGRKRFFRVWHPLWQQRRVNVELIETSLLARNWRWFDGARLAGANVSPGFREVLMGRPHRIR